MFPETSTVLTSHMSWVPFSQVYMISPSSVSLNVKSSIFRFECAGRILPALSYLLIVVLPTWVLLPFVTANLIKVPRQPCAEPQHLEIAEIIFIVRMNAVCLSTLTFPPRNMALTIQTFPRRSTRSREENPGRRTGEELWYRAPSSWRPPSARAKREIFMVEGRLDRRPSCGPYESSCTP